ncbi:Bifunctional purine biosynthesis protein PurH [Streptomyces griseus]
MSVNKPIRRALVSVYDKTGLEDLARGLHEAGVELVSTGSTAGKIAAAGVPVTKVEELTGFPECLDGRVKTLHPRVHAGILADLRLDAHREQLAELGVEPFDLVVVNLYPFKETVASGASDDECVEQIDIGGPSMVRAAAKNHPSVAVVTSPERYADVLAAAKAGGFDLTARKRLAAEAFQHTAAYDVAVASWFADDYAAADDSGLPEFLGDTFARKNVLRYGENPHQPAALYTSGDGGLAEAEQLHGKEMSYNNYTDTDAARRAAYDHAEPCVAIIKHANPCGIAIADDVATAHRNAHACDPLSAFGGVIAVNRPVTVELGRAGRGDLHRGHRRPGLRGRRRRGAAPGDLPHRRRPQPGGPGGAGRHPGRVAGRDGHHADGPPHLRPHRLLGRRSPGHRTRHRRHQPGLRLVPPDPGPGGVRRAAAPGGALPAQAPGRQLRGDGAHDAGAGRDPGRTRGLNAGHGGRPHPATGCGLPPYRVLRRVSWP